MDPRSNGNPDVETPEEKAERLAREQAYRDEADARLKAAGPLVVKTGFPAWAIIVICVGVIGAVAVAFYFMAK